MDCVLCVVIVYIPLSILLCMYWHICTYVHVCKVRVSLNIPVCAPEVCPLVAGRSLGTIIPTYIPRSQPLEKELKIQ